MFCFLIPCQNHQASLPTVKLDHQELNQRSRFAMLVVTTVLWKSNCFLNLITACATLRSKNSNQVFVISGNEPFTSPWKNLVPIFFADCFNSATWKVFQYDQIRPSQFWYEVIFFKLYIYWFVCLFFSFKHEVTQAGST